MPENRTITGLHLLLTYECNFECDHCFVLGGPRQDGAMTLHRVREILDQAEEAGGVEWIYFEGGEPFLYYAALLDGVRNAAERGFRVGMVSNAYWATGPEDATRSLEPFAGLVQDLSISSDSYHWNERDSRQTRNAVAAAEQLGIPIGLISIAEPEESHVAAATGQIPEGESAVVFRGRAVEKLAGRADLHDWRGFDTCPFEDLRDPGRVHVDPFGYVHVCQGISLGNLFEKPLKEIFADHDPDAHPVTGPLLAGGPAELARKHGLACRPGYADACHLCFETRLALRGRYPDALAPDAMYGVCG
ncbi:MAG: 4Fe-4S cluster-binding domain-containing protein [Xanthomonadales bacterium]|nr:4Fe-4S cluster-binding domain-containing protein [Xanthomonadales bacterium]NIX13556.1 4Fe-4S cluster-binding domain-containing protein [Xanthomonadales bacterium]